MVDTHELSLLNRLPQVRGRYSEGSDLSKVTWFRVGGPAQVFFKPEDPEDLAFFMRQRPSDVPVTPIGVGSNLLVRDGGVPGIVVRLGRSFTNLMIRGNEIDVGAGFLDRNLALIAQEEGLTGLEFLVGIPGTIGGALRMNAGCYGSEVKDSLAAAFALDPKGHLKTLTSEDMDFRYRHCGIPEDWIFIGARFKARSGHPKLIAEQMQKIMSEREEAQPVRSRTGGSTFANPEGFKAWQLIDQAGCRGLKYGGAQVSEKHCNFLINTGNATAEDLESLGEEVRARVLKTAGIDLRWEIKRIGVKSSSIPLAVMAA